MYSTHLGVAGTVDCIAEYDGELSIIDFKTKNIIPKMRKSFRSVRNQTTSGLKYCRNPRQKSLSMNSATKLLNWDGRDVASMFLSLLKMPFEYLVQHQSANYRLNFID